MLRKWLSDIDDSADVELLTSVILVVDESVDNLETDDEVLSLLKHDFDVANPSVSSIVNDGRTDSDVDEVVNEGRTDSDVEEVVNEGLTDSDVGEVVNEGLTDSDVEEVVNEGRTGSRSLLLQFQRLLKDELVFDC